jgi:hypothetical protein
MRTGPPGSPISAGSMLRQASAAQGVISWASARGTAGPAQTAAMAATAPARRLRQQFEFRRNVIGLLLSMDIFRPRTAPIALPAPFTSLREVLAALPRTLQRYLSRRKEQRWRVMAVADATAADRGVRLLGCCGRDMHHWLRVPFKTLRALASGVEASSAVVVAKLGGRN